jgi:putative pre-16S rRNA nuclease
VDLGTRRIGLARSDRSRTLASPWQVLPRTGDRDGDARALLSAAREAEVNVVVVGLPLSLDGSRGPAAQRALDEVATLRRMFEPEGITVETVDERFTTTSAHAALAEAGRRGRERRGTVDAAAAAVLLQAWLDATSRPVGPGSARA